MLKVFLATSLLVVSAASVQAGAVPFEKHLSGRPSAQRYWLSDGLNRLVFWKPSNAMQRDEKRTN